MSVPVEFGDIAQNKGHYTVHGQKWKTGTGRQVRKCWRQLSWHADSGQLHITTEAGGAALKLRATAHSCYVIQCVQPGRV